MISHIDFTERCGYRKGNNTTSHSAIKIWSENHWPSYQTLIHCLPLYLHLLHSTRIASMRACAQALDICMIFVCALAAIDYNFILYYIRLVWSEKKVFICKWLNHHHPHFSLLHCSYYYSMENWERRNKQYKNGNRLLYMYVRTLCTLCGGSSQIIWELFFSLDFCLCLLCTGSFIDVGNHYGFVYGIVHVWQSSPK